MSYGAQHNLPPPSHKSQVFQHVCGLHASSCCGWAVIIAGTLVGRVSTQASWLWIPAMTVAGILVCRAGPAEWEPLWRGSGDGQDSSLCWGRTEATVEGLARATILGKAGPQRNVEEGKMMLPGLMKSGRNGACQHQHSWVQGEYKWACLPSAGFPGWG